MARHAPERKATSRGPASVPGARPSRLARPSDAREVHDAAVRVHNASRLRRHQPHPGGPAPIVAQRRRDRVGEVRRRHRVGVQEHEEVPSGHSRARVRGRGEADVSAGLDHGRCRRKIQHHRQCLVAGVVVDYHQLIVRIELHDQWRQRGGKRGAAVVGDDDHRQAHCTVQGHGGAMLASRRRATSDRSAALCRDKRTSRHPRSG